MGTFVPKWKMGISSQNKNGIFSPTMRSFIQLLCKKGKQCPTLTPINNLTPENNLI